MGEQPPCASGDRAAETIRLAEIGDLTSAELAALEEKANEARLRIGTDSERLMGAPFRDLSGRDPQSRERPGLMSCDVNAVALWDAIVAARAVVSA